MNIKYGAGSQGQITLDQRTVNLYLMERFANTLLPYQNALQVFSFMELNQDKQYIRHRSNLTGAFWQPHVPCKKTPQGSMAINSVAANPCALDFFMEICSEMWGTCFQYMDRFNSDGTVTTPDFDRIFSLAYKDISNTAARELLSVLFLGKFFSNQAGLTPNINVAYEDQVAFAKEEAACTGLLWYLTQNIPSCEVFNGIDYTSCNNLQDILAMLERLRCCARDSDANFGQIVDLGFMPGTGEAAPVILVSGNLYGRLTGSWTGLQNISSPAFSPIGKVEVAGANGSKYLLYTYHGIPVVPISAINAWDSKYTAMSTQFVAMTVAGNIEFGTNFAGSLVAGIEEPVAFEIARKPGLENKNIVQVAASALLDVNVINPELLVWDVSRVTPA